MSQTFTSLSLRIRTLETEQYHTHDFQGWSHGLLCDPLVHKKKSKSFYTIKFTGFLSNSKHFLNIHTKPATR